MNAFIQSQTATFRTLHDFFHDFYYKNHEKTGICSRTTVPVQKIRKAWSNPDRNILGDHSPVFIPCFVKLLRRKLCKSEQIASNQELIRTVFQFAYRIQLSVLEKVWFENKNFQARTEFYSSLQLLL